MYILEWASSRYEQFFHSVADVRASVRPCLMRLNLRVIVSRTIIKKKDSR